MSNQSSRKIYVGRNMPEPAWESEAQRRTDNLLREVAIGFALRCRTMPNPKFLSDQTREPKLLYAMGLEKDECEAFLRAVDSGLVTIESDGNFQIPAARASSRNLHLVGREVGHVKLHREVLIHIGIFAELVLDLDWDPSLLVFDPFMSGAALDIWGYEEISTSHWSEGIVIFAAEAKGRIKGSDGLEALLKSFRKKESDPGAVIPPNHAPKWNELFRLTVERSLDLLLAANDARWWFTVARRERTIAFEASHTWRTRQPESPPGEA